MGIEDLAVRANIFFFRRKLEIYLEIACVAANLLDVFDEIINEFFGSAGIPLDVLEKVLVITHLEPGQDEVDYETGFSA